MSTLKEDQAANVRLWLKRAGERDLSVTRIERIQQMLDNQGMGGSVLKAPIAVAAHCMFRQRGCNINHDVLFEACFVLGTLMASNVRGSGGNATKFALADVATKLDSYDVYMLVEDDLRDIYVSLIKAMNIELTKPTLSRPKLKLRVSKATKA